MPTLKMRVNVNCSGCEKRIRKELRKVEGVERVEVDMERKTVTVTGSAATEKVFKAVWRTGKSAELWTDGPGASTYGYNNYGVPAVAAPGVWAGYHPSQQYPAPGYLPYNHYQHGYDDLQRQQHWHGGGGGGGYTVVPDGQASAAGDDNPHACSVM